MRNMLIWPKKLLYHLTIKSRITPKVIQQIPYFSQWESAGLVDKILAGQITPLQDPDWKKSGAQTKEEYYFWSWSICGMACLKMVLSAKFKKNYQAVTLAKKCLKYGGYIDNSANFDSAGIVKQKKPVPSAYYEGMFYEPLVRFIREEYNLQGKIIKPMIIEDITRALSDNKYPIVSVSASIRNAQSNPKSKGGHLVLIVGYDLVKKLLYIHNPSGFYQKSQKYYPISFKNFAKFFAHRGVIVG